MSISIETNVCSSDVYSFGILMWEVFSYGAHPYANMSAMETVRRVARV